MAVLELRYQSPDPSAPRQPPYRPTATTVDSIPFHSTPSLCTETILETHPTIPPFPCWGKPPVKHGASGNAAAQAPSPLPPLAHDALYSLSMYMHDTHTLKPASFYRQLSFPLSFSSYSTLFLPAPLLRFIF